MYCVGLDEANQAGTEMECPTWVPMGPAREVWLCSVVNLLCARQGAGGVASAGLRGPLAGYACNTD